MAEASLNAVDDAGLSIRDIDAVFTAGWRPTEVAEYLGLAPRYIDGTQVGGSSYVIHVGHAAAAIANGLCEIALIVHGESGRSRVGMFAEGGGPQLPAGQFEAPYGLPGWFDGWFTLHHLRQHHPEMGPLDPAVAARVCTIMAEAMAR